MNTIKIKIAGCIFEIDVSYFHIYRICQDFFTDETADCRITLSKEDLLKEKCICNLLNVNDIDGIPEYYLEAQAIHRKISEKLLDTDTLLLHGAAIAFNNVSYIFTGPSGIGKTTHINKWLENIPSSFVINGDKPYIKINETDIITCSSPWSGKEELHTNTMAPLKAIILMERADNNHIERITFAQAFPFLLQQIYRPEDAEKMRKTLSLMQRLSTGVSFYRFYCNNFKDDCFEVVFQGLVNC